MIRNILAQQSYIATLALVLITYFVTALFGLSVHPVNTFATLIWPPTGIAIAALTLWGYRLWPAIFLGAFFANFYTGAPFLVAVGMAIGNTLEAVTATYFLYRFVGVELSFGKLRESFIFIVGASLLSPLVSATIGITALFLGNVISLSSVPATWLAWFVGDMLGALVVAPFLLRWLSQPYYQRTLLELVEVIAAVAISAAAAIFVFWTSYVRFPYVILIPLVWAALRTGPRGTTLATLLVSAIALSGTVVGYGPFAYLPIEQALLPLQVFLATLASMLPVFVSVVEDRRRAADALEKHVQELERGLEKSYVEDQTKNEFIATLAHELRNPLASIVSSLELMKMREGTKARVSREAVVLERHAKDMTKLLDDLLDLSRIAGRKFGLRKKRIDACQVVTQAAESAQQLIISRGHTLEISKPSYPLLLDADSLRLQQIVVNLLSNAAKYTPPGGRITLRCERNGSEVVIAVRDTGVGIAASMLGHIFEPFVQLKRSPSVQEGIGIGLSITKKLVEMHGGSITARSEGEGKGSEFVVRIPLTTLIAPSSSVGKPQVKELAQVPPQKILLVDDNTDAAQAPGKLLGMRGHEVTLASDGGSALRMAPLLKPNIIILDIGLPDFDGYEVARRLKKAEVGAPLIALTGYGQESDKTKARKAGFMHHLTKPVSLSQMEEALAKVVAKIGPRR